MSIWIATAVEREVKLEEIGSHEAGTGETSIEGPSGQVEAGLAPSRCRANEVLEPVPPRGIAPPAPPRGTGKTSGGRHSVHSNQWMDVSLSSLVVWEGVAVSRHIVGWK